MTFRPKPVVPRSRRPVQQSSSRRHLLVNIGLGLAAALGVLSLVGALVVTYADFHWASVASVDGASVSKDQFRDRLKVETFRLDQTESRIQSEAVAGHLDNTIAQQELQTLEQQQRPALPTTALEGLIDDMVQAKLAADKGIAVSAAQVDAQLTKEATSPELRHILLLTVQPVLATGETTATDAEKAAAKAKADAALASINGGKTFQEVAKSTSSDGYASNGGDAGWITGDDNLIDTTFVKAVFALQKGAMTDVIAGSDNAYRIGKVLDIQAQVVDSGWTQKIQNAGASLDAYRATVKGDLIKTALSDKVVADTTTVPTVQRLVSEIFINTSNYTGTGDEVLVRHILYTPGNADPQTSPPPTSDPSWNSAKALAQATYDKLKLLVGTPALETEFSAIAKTDSKDTASGANGGLLSYYTQTQLDPAFGSAIFAAGLKKGDLLPPVQSAFGWHVIVFEGRRLPPEQRVAALQVQLAVPGADFAALAKDGSDAADASVGGDMGWVARLQLDPTLEAAIFAAPIGKVSDQLTTTDGHYLFLVREEQTRLPSGTQLETLKASAFQNWYNLQKAKASINRSGTLPTS